MYSQGISKKIPYAFFPQFYFFLCNLTSRRPFSLPQAFLLKPWKPMTVHLPVPGVEHWQERPHSGIPCVHNIRAFPLHPTTKPILSFFPFIFQIVLRCVQKKGFSRILKKKFSENHGKDGNNFQEKERSFQNQVFLEVPLKLTNFKVGPIIFSSFVFWRTICFIPKWIDKVGGDSKAATNSKT